MQIASRPINFVCVFKTRLFPSLSQTLKLLLFFHDKYIWRLQSVQEQCLSLLLFEETAFSLHHPTNREELFADGPALQSKNSLKINYKIR
jgi:hypothetical protein